MSGPEAAPPGINVNVPSVARVYDYFLGGKDNFASDRAVVEHVMKLMPPNWDSTRGARENRAFLRRVVRFLVREAGIRQFIDIGSGLPTQGNVHEIAHEQAPEARVLYVDNDPIVLVHARALLARGQNTRVVTADLREPEKIFHFATEGGFIDPGRPIGLLLLAILHHINDDEDPEGMIARYRDFLPSGSHLAISHFRNPGDAHPEAKRLSELSERIFTQHLGTGRFRRHEEIQAYFGDMEMVEPGLVVLPEWRPDPDDEITEHHTYHMFVGGVARKP